MQGNQMCLWVGKKAGEMRHGTSLSYRQPDPALLAQSQ